MTGPYLIPAGRYAVDASALKALKAVYWGSQGWRTGAKPDEATAAVLRAAGLWTDRARRKATHDDVVMAAVEVASRTSRLFEVERGSQLKSTRPEGLAAHQ